jgi:hypothetical protein
MPLFDHAETTSMATTSSKPDYTRQYARLLELGTPYALALAGGEILDPTGGCHLGPADPTAAAQALAQDFERAELIASRICRDAEDGVLVLRDEFLREAGPLLALRSAPGANPSSLLTQRGATPRSRAALWPALGDYATRELLQRSGGALLIARSMAQVAALRTIGLAAAPATGLHGMPENLWRRLSQGLGVVGHELGYDVETDEPIEIMPDGRKIRIHKNCYLGQAPPDPGLASAALAGDREELDEIARRTALKGQRVPLELMLVLTAWSPWGWTDADEATLLGVARHIVEIERAVPDIAPPMAVWRPGEEERREIAAAVLHGSADACRAAILRSLESSAYALRRFVEGSGGVDASPTDFPTSEQELVDALSEGAEEDVVRERQRTYGRMLRRDLIAPQQAQALASDDPVVTTLQMSLADQSEMVMLMSPPIKAQLSAATAARGGLSPETTQLLRERERNVHSLLRMAALLRPSRGRR